MIRKKSIASIAAMIYIFLIFVNSDQIGLALASAVLAVGFIAVNFNGFRFKCNSFFYLELGFAAFCMLQVILGIAVLKSVTWANARRMMINLVDEMLLFNLLIRLDNIDDILKTFLYPFVVGILLILLLHFTSGHSLLMRLKTNVEGGVTYRFLGLKVSVGSATIIGHCALCAFAFSLIGYYGDKKKEYAIMAAIALIGVVLSSSRKALAIAVALMVLVPEFREHNIKRLQRLFVGALLVIAILVLVMRVPALYDLVGVRLERMIVSLITGESVDHSMAERGQLRALAWNAFLQRPLAGWGSNSFKTLFYDDKIYSHCNYLELLSGTGLIGTGIFLMKYLFLMNRAFSNLRNGNGLEKYYCKCFMVWLAMVWIMEYWQVTYYNERMIIHYLIILAMLTKLRQKRTRKIRIELRCKPTLEISGAGCE